MANKKLEVRKEPTYVLTLTADEARALLVLTCSLMGEALSDVYEALVDEVDDGGYKLVRNGEVIYSISLEKRG